MWFKSNRKLKEKGIDISHLKLGLKTKYSPDAALLQRRANHLVFIYDGMQARMINHASLGKGVGIVRQGAVTEESFTLWKKDVGLIPTVFPLRSNLLANKSLPVKGDLLLIPTERLFWLDELRENGVQFTRERVSIAIPRRIFEGKVGHAGIYFDATTDLSHQVQAWMYVGSYKYWYPMLDGGYLFKSIKKIHPNNEAMSPYYLYNEHEHTPF